MSDHDAPLEKPSPAPPLARARDAYARGDFASVRVEVAAALEATPDAEAAQEAHALEARIGADAWSWAVLGACFALFCGILAAYVR